MNWALLNPATEEMRAKAKAVSDLHFTGDLSHETGPYRAESDEGDVVYACPRCMGKIRQL